MKAYSALALFALAALLSPAQAGELTGQYVEARTCDVWTGACFANAEMNISGKHAVLAWKFDQGRVAGVAVDGLSVLAVIEASDTLGLTQTGPSRAVLLVDQKADAAQREALIAAARKLGGKLTANVIDVQTAPISFDVNCCKEGGCAKVDAGVARITTRCIHEDEDKVCGHEDNFYPPLAQGARARSAMVTEHSFRGDGFNKTWNDSMRRGAYIGTFSVRD